jgi:RNA-directed DNA polymerase
VNQESPSENSINLFDKIVSDSGLKSAFMSVWKNKGAAGIDGVTVEKFAENLTEELGQLRNELHSWTYKPRPVKRVEIPKAEGIGKRLLGIPCVRDRVVQASIKQVLEPLFEEIFSDNSYGFRPERNQELAVKAAQRIVQSGKEYVVDIDLSNFFDRIPHDRLIGRIKQTADDPKVLKLIGMILRSGVMVDGVVSFSSEGSVQGSPLSPLLSNIVLDELDKELERRGLEFCRFADDCNIFVKSQKAGERVMGSVTNFIEDKLKLVVNQSKSKVAKSSAVKFLGMTIILGMLAISTKSMQKAMDKVKELTPRGTHISMEASVIKFNKWYVGWSNYYKMTQYPSQLYKIEAHVRRRLRSRIIGQKKKRHYLYRDLVKKGVVKRTAAKAVYSENKGRWKLSHTRAMEIAYPNRWFTNTMGLRIRSDQALDHWFDTKTWVKLT